jgi:hypothetical protein
VAPVDDRRIAEETLIPVALRTRRRLKCDPDKWNNYEIEQIISACGSPAISVENVRVQCVGLRKAGKLGTLGKGKNHGATIRPDPPDWYKQYLESDHWKLFRRIVLEFWDYKCAWCSSEKRVEVHHRTYCRLQKERLQDCICLCKMCHDAATRQQIRAKKNREAERQMSLI